MDEIKETQLIENQQEQAEEIAAEIEEDLCGNCEKLSKLQGELAQLSAENNRLREELEQMKKLPSFSTKTVAEKNGLEAVRSIFRKR